MIVESVKNLQLMVNVHHVNPIQGNLVTEGHAGEIIVQVDKGYLKMVHAKNVLTTRQEAQMEEAVLKLNVGLRKFY